MLYRMLRTTGAPIVVSARVLSPIDVARLADVAMTRQKRTAGARTCAGVRHSN